MKTPFTQTMSYTIGSTIDARFVEKIPEMIRKHTDWDYSCQQKNEGCFLKPTFRNMPYRNSFVPEIDIVVSCHEAYTTLQISGRPVKFVRVFMGMWFGVLSLIEILLLILTITSDAGGVFAALIPIALCVFSYLLCKVGVKSTFNSVVKAIQKECS